MKTGPMFTPRGDIPADRAGDDRAGGRQRAFVVVAELDLCTRRQDDLSAVGVHVAREPVHAELAPSCRDTRPALAAGRATRPDRRVEQRVGMRELDDVVVTRAPAGVPVRICSAGSSERTLRHGHRPHDGRSPGSVPCRWRRCAGSAGHRTRGQDAGARATPRFRPSRGSDQPPLRPRTDRLGGPDPVIINDDGRHRGRAMKVPECMPCDMRKAHPPPYAR